MKATMQYDSAELHTAPGMPAEAPTKIGAVAGSSMSKAFALVMTRPWILVLGMLAMLYVNSHYYLPGRVDARFATQVIVPITWLLLAGPTFLMARREGLIHLTFTTKLLGVSLVVGAFQVAVFIIAGLLLGFGESPYASNVLGIATNMFYVTSLLLGMEISRSYRVSVFGKRGIFAGVGLVVILYALVLIPPARFLTLGNPDKIFEFLGFTLVPNLAQSLLTTLLAFLGGPVAAIAFRGVIMGFEWGSPVLPDLTWTAFGLAGLFGPMFGFFVLQSGAATTESSRRVDDKIASESPNRSGFLRPLLTGATFVMSALVLVVVLLNVGVFGYKSMAVITGSMSPVIGIGDVVVTKPVSADELAVGDVVKYRRSGIDIVHRIVSMQTTSDGLALTTKGDANNATDRATLTVDELTGVVIARVPKIGWITIWMNGGLN